MAFGQVSYQHNYAEYGYAITPNDTYTYSASRPPWKMLYVGGAGNITYVDTGGNQVTLVAVPVGAQLLVCGKYVMATGTTATNLVALV